MISLPILQATVEAVREEELTPKHFCLHIVQKHHSFTSKKHVHICKFQKLMMKEGTQNMFWWVLCSFESCYLVILIEPSLTQPWIHRYISSGVSPKKISAQFPIELIWLYNTFLRSVLGNNVSGPFYITYIYYNNWTSTELWILYSTITSDFYIQLLPCVKHRSVWPF